MSDRQPTHSVLIETGDRDSDDKTYTRKIGVAWQTDGGAIFIKTDFPVVVTSAYPIRLVPCKPKS